MKISGNSLFVKALKDEGVDTLFAYPGGCVIDLFDELYKQRDIEMILPRHEQAAVHAADGYARSTGKVGVCLVTSGPGATNIVTGIATANYDSVPIVCFTGQVPTRLIGNDAFQEVDIVGITRSITKHSIMVTKREDLGRVIKEAFFIANTGRKGPVVIDLPSDIMKELGDNRYPKEVNIRSYKPTTNVHIGQLKKALGILEEAKKPVFLIGGGVNIAKANEEFTKLVELTGIPVITTIMGKGAIATNHKLYIGNIGMHGSYAANKAISECDVMFSIGTRFNDRITGKISEFAPNAKIIHIDIDTASISRNIKVDIPIVADAKLAIEKIMEMAKPLNIIEWVTEVTNWKAEFPLKMESKNGISPQKIFETINNTFDNSVIVTDVGQHQMWTTQFIELNQNRQLLTSGGLGTMGYGFPAAIGAQLGNPDKKVICISGDGGIQMNIQELATAVAQELPLIIMIFNNSYLGMVRQWQQLFYDKRYSSTCLTSRKSCKKNCLDPNKECPPYSPDFVKLAESYGAIGIRVTKEDEIMPAFEKASSSTDTPIIIEFIIDSNQLVLPMVKSGNPLSEMIMEG
ncbi:MAG: acetolactate synthase, large subunit, biosynthetic type [Clostridiales bacterium]|jgi:acetolactate synthase-1/2/3 large subunit|nr:acetolactate synthase, large subunit, biosynthetic type [Clostridiales bacterium]